MPRITVCAYTHHHARQHSGHDYPPNSVSAVFTSVFCVCVHARLMCTILLAMVFSFLPLFAFSAIEEQMGSFPEPPKTIERVLHSTGATVRERMAAIVCHGQQQCLLALQRALKQCDCS